MKRFLTWLGAFLLFLGLVTAFVSNRYVARTFDVIAEKNVIADFNMDSPRNKEIRKNSGISDVFFWSGLALTAVGILLQAIGVSLREPQ